MKIGDLMLKNKFFISLIMLTLPIILISKDALKVGKMSYKYSADESNPKASYYSVNYPRFQNINEELKQEIYFDLEIANKKKDINNKELYEIMGDKCFQFISEFEKNEADLKKYDSEATPHNFIYDESFQSKMIFHILAIQVNKNSFTGGAHGTYSTKNFNYDINSNKRLKLKDVFTNVDSLYKVAENKFRTVYKVPQGAKINSSGFQFPEDKFELTENFLIENDGITLLWNPYEIAAYSYGQISLKLKYKEVNDLLKIIVLRD